VTLLVTDRSGATATRDHRGVRGATSCDDGNPCTPMPDPFVTGATMSQAQSVLHDGTRCTTVGTCDASGALRRHRAGQL